MPWTKRVFPILLLAAAAALTGCQTSGEPGGEPTMPYAGWDRAEER